MTALQISKATMDSYMQLQQKANNYDYCKGIAEHVHKQIKTLADAKEPTTIAIICGTGLGFLADEMTEVSPTRLFSLSNATNYSSQVEAINYKDIPGFPVGNIEGHRGRLVFGRLEGHRVMAMQGRVHPYEGRTLAECALPIRVASILGCKTLLMTSAVGGINGGFQRGNLMAVYDQIFVPGMALRSPLVGPNEER